MTRWKDLVEEPLNRFYRYPVARVLVRGLLRTRISANQVTAIQPFLALVAACALTLPGYRGLLLAVAVFEVRTVLDCADGTLARARGTASPAGHALDGLCDWLSTVILHGGILYRLVHTPDLPTTTFGVTLGVKAVLALALLQAALRSFASDHYLQHLGPIFDRGADESEAALREKIQADAPGFLPAAEIFIGRMGHLILQGKWVTKDALDEPRSPHPLSARKDSAGTRALAAAWSLSSGDAYLSWLMLTLLFDAVWAGQVLFATVGFAQIVVLIAVTAFWVRRSSA